PAPGISTLTTSAPKSPSSWAQYGPARMRVKSAMRMPASGLLLAVMNVRPGSATHEHRLALFEVGADALLVVLRGFERSPDLLVQFRRLRERQVIALVDGALHGRQAQGAGLVDFRREGQRRLQQLAARDDGLDQTHAGGLRSIDAARSEEHLLGLRRPDQ